MSKWPTVRLGDVFDLQMGKTPSRSDSRYWRDGIFPWVSISDMNSEKYIHDTKEKISIFAKQETGIKLIPKDTVIMSFKLSIGKTAITGVPLYTNEAIMAFLDKGFYKIDKHYLYWALTTKIWSENTNKAVKGATLNKSSLSNETIVLPSIETQKKIADVLDKAKSLIDLRKKQIEKMDLLIKSKFIEMFGDPVTNPKGWPTKELKDITSKIGSGATPRGGKESYIKYGICLIRSMNVHNGKFKYEELAHIDESQAKQLENVTVFENDVLINITGASVARSCVVPKTTLPARVNQHVSIIRCNPKVISYQYMNKLLINESYQKKLLSIGGAGGATREAITKRQLELLEIPLPPLDLQNQFACFVELVEKQKKLFEQALDKMEINYKSLMQEYFG